MFLTFWIFCLSTLHVKLTNFCELIFFILISIRLFVHITLSYYKAYLFLYYFLKHIPKRNGFWPILSCPFFKHLLYIQSFQPTVSADVLEKYIALEEQIAEAEKDSPAMLLQQKQEQIQQLSIRIEEQHELVDQLTAQA